MQHADDKPVKALRRRLGKLQQKLDEADARESEAFAQLARELDTVERQVLEELVEDVDAARPRRP